MAEKTKIAWTDATFNPWIGCAAISPGCEHCYAAAYAKRVGRDFAVRTRTSAANWHKPVVWQRYAEKGISPDGKTYLGRRPRIFCASLADVFDNQVPDEWRYDLWRLVRATPGLDWQILTKRIGNVAKMHPGGFYENIWLGATVVNQEEADRDVPKLLAVNGVAKRFVSYEPALGPVNWLRFRGLDQIIIGGESGHHARHFLHDWARSTIAQCRQIGAAPFMKQTGTDLALLYERVQKDRAGADPAEWPEDLRVREF